MWAIVPCKRIEAAKRRLGSILSGEERRLLVRAMLRDVLGTLAEAPSVDGVMVVTRDVKVQAVAERAGAYVLGERGEPGQSEAVVQAVHVLEAEGVRSVVVVPSDVPLMTVDDLQAIAARQTGAPAVTIVPSLDERGTNALACSPSRLLQPQFGDDSLERHLRAARARGIEPALLRLPGLALDIDHADDLRDFLARPSATRAFT